MVLWDWIDHSDLGQWLVAQRCYGLAKLSSCNNAPQHCSKKNYL